jgi:hypothetical protein
MHQAMGAAFAKLRGGGGESVANSVSALTFAHAHQASAAQLPPTPARRRHRTTFTQVRLPILFKIENTKLLTNSSYFQNIS